MDGFGIWVPIEYREMVEECRSVSCVGIHSFKLTTTQAAILMEKIFNIRKRRIWDWVLKD